MICPECGYQRVAHNGYCPICKRKERMAASTPVSTPACAPLNEPTAPYPESNPHFTANGTQGGAPANDSLILALGLIGFFFPLVGLILYLALRGSEPLRARSAGRGALWGTLFWLVLAYLLPA